VFYVCFLLVCVDAEFHRRAAGFIRAYIRRGAVVIVIEIRNDHAPVIPRTGWIKREFPNTIMSIIYWNTMDSVSLRARSGNNIAVEQIVIEIIGCVSMWITDTIVSVIGDMENIISRSGMGKVRIVSIDSTRRSLIRRWGL